MDDAFAKRYERVDWTALAGLSVPTKSSTFGLTTPGIPNIGQILQARQNSEEKWHFDFSIPTFEQHWTAQNNGSAGAFGIGPGSYEVCRIGLDRDPANPWNIKRIYGRGEDDRASDLTIQDQIPFFVRIALGDQGNPEQASLRYFWNVQVPGQDKDVAPTQAARYTVFLDISDQDAQSVAAKEEEHFADFRAAYNLVFPAFEKAARNISPQESEADLWKALYSSLTTKGNYLRGAAPNLDREEEPNNATGWKPNLLRLFGELCDCSKQRDRGLNADHHPVGYIIAWASNTAWGPQEVNLGSGGRKNLRADNGQIRISFKAFPESRTKTPDIINEAAALQTEQAKRKLRPLT